MSDENTIDYLGLGQAGDVWGGVTVNFEVDSPHQGAKELSILLNNPAVAVLGAECGEETTETFEELAARAVGEAWIRKALAAGHHLDSVVTISEATLREQPDFVEAVKQAAQAATPA